MAIIAALSFSVHHTNAAAQTLDDHRFEVGAQFTSINLVNFEDRLTGRGGNDSSFVKGVGGRITYNFTDHIALDAEANFFPETAFDNREFGQKTQTFVGIKAGTRNKYAGVFAKARPGVMWFGELSTLTNCSSTFSSATFVCAKPGQKDFAMDVGGIVEFYPSKRSIIRVDAGDTIVRFREEATTLGLNNTVRIPGDTTHNLQVSIGFSYRF
jgi:hypothetical protein